MDLFDNPMVRAAEASMTEEQKAAYRAVGEQMYGNVDFETSQVLNNMPPPMEEAVAYICSGLNSGLHPSDLESNDIALLTDAYGSEWYKRWDYKKEDLEGI